MKRRMEETLTKLDSDAEITHIVADECTQIEDLELLKVIPPDL